MMMIRKVKNSITSTATNLFYSLSFITTGNNTNMSWKISSQINMENFLLLIFMNVQLSSYQTVEV